MSISQWFQKAAAGFLKRDARSGVVPVDPVALPVKTYPTREVITAAYGTDDTGQRRSSRATVAAAAEALGVEKSQVRRWIRTGQIPRTEMVSWNRAKGAAKSDDFTDAQAREREVKPWSPAEQITNLGGYTDDLSKREVAQRDKELGRKLGVKPATVSRWRRGKGTPSESHQQAISRQLLRDGKASIPEVTPTYDVDTMLTAVYGKDGKVNYTQAAKDMGISTATLRKFRTTGQPPTRATKGARAFSKLRRAAEKEHAKGGTRSTIVNTSRRRLAGKLRSTGVTMKISGYHGVRTATNEYFREQDLRVRLDKEQFDVLAAAFEDGEESFADALETAADGEVTGWEFSRIDQIAFE